MTPDAATIAAVIERYARFAREEAPGRSELYAEWSAGIAGDPDAAAVLARIPETRRQPPLVFAVARMLGSTDVPYPQWRAWLLGHADELVAEASVRSLQTNEPGRCAALLPGLSRFSGPLALLELGASAGLCLYPDRYSYRYRGGPSLDPPGGTSTVVLEADLVGSPRCELPDVVWRAGIDLAPLDAADPGDRDFLTALVWPGETGRAERIAAALDIVAADPPLLITGDASDPQVLRDAVALAPADATLVVTAPGVLPHIPREGRERLRATLDALGVSWMSIDPPWMHDAWHPPVVAGARSDFVLSMNGVPVAAVDPLGGFVEWRANEGRVRG
ncbi:DUF2332 domain-containing protein [Microbacterium sp. SLBN-146]|uniref:DUF2332 domain-containing protein n=1 Tax=Microbacterium sp. SLBN-146 TaxID=2768457 RepID=UPI0011522F94|nr:DUF2332 domain-containing protein [Microbacterium sp. SLBN-146]TQJ31438.1 uncharacterized protein DUF2332 [Microbacterium sp. SLBN-146]